MPPTTKPGSPTNEDAMGTIDIGADECHIKAGQVKAVDDAVKKDPDKTLSVVRNWLHQEN